MRCEEQAGYSQLQTSLLQTLRTVSCAGRWRRVPQRPGERTKAGRCLARSGMFSLCAVRESLAPSAVSSSSPSPLAHISEDDSGCQCGFSPGRHGGCWAGFAGKEPGSVTEGLSSSRQGGASKGSRGTRQTLHCAADTLSAATASLFYYSQSRPILQGGGRMLIRH